MTVQRTGTLSGDAEKKWKAIDWQEAQRCVRRLQMRIAKAVKEGRQSRAKALQWLLTHSLHAKLLADDFIVTGKSKTILETKVRPAIETFLTERGLELSEEKTVISHIKDAFTFLGQTFRRHGSTLHITPSKEGVLALMRKLGDIIRLHRSAPMEVLIKKLNQLLRGWANYHRHVVSSEIFSRVDNYVYEQLWRMIRRRHQNKSKNWLHRQYWSASGRKHVFSVFLNYKGKKHLLQVVRICSIGIRRHIKIKADANPYMPEYAGYFWRRRNR